MDVKLGKAIFRNGVNFYSNNFFRTAPINQQGVAAAPTFNPVDGSSIGPGDTVALASTTPSADFWYTTDGTTPAPASGTSILYSGPFTLTASTLTIKAITVKAGYTNSAVSTATYVWSGIVATGGTITTDGNYKIHTFDASDNFVITSGVGNVDYLVVDGGAGGGYQGGGGAGGWCQEGTFASMTIGTYPTVVGAGGAKGPNSSVGWGFQGNPSSANGINGDATGAGGGGRYDQAGKNGGKTGGGGGSGGGGPNVGGTGSLKNGGDSYANGPAGGGASMENNGNNAPDANHGGNGGEGYSTSIRGSTEIYGSGGGGGGGCPTGIGSGGIGGTDAGNGGTGLNGFPTVAATAGTANKGGGGGGGFGYFTSDQGENGGSGRVVYKYRYK